MEKKNTVLKKDKAVKIQTKTGQSYQYKFSTLAEIHRYLDETNQHYESFILPEGEVEYFYTQKLTPDGQKLGEPLRGARIPKVQSLKEYGGALTTCRRYSLLMAYGLACEDDDSNDAPVENAVEKWKKMHTASADNPVSAKQRAAIKQLCERLKKTSVESLAIISNCHNAAEASKLISSLQEEIIKRDSEDA